MMFKTNKTRLDIKLKKIYVVTRAYNEVFYSENFAKKTLT